MFLFFELNKLSWNRKQWMIPSDLVMKLILKYGKTKKIALYNI